MATVVWSRVRTGAIDESTGRAGEPTELRRTIDAAGIFPGMTQRKLMQGQTLIQDARKVLIAGIEMDPYEIDPKDTLDFEGSSWTVYEVKKLAPDGGAAILFTVFVER